MPAWHFLALAQDSLARIHVEVEGLFRRGGRLVGEPEVARVIFIARRQAEVIRRLVEVDFVDIHLFVIRHDDTRQCVLALEAYDAVPEGHKAGDVGPGPVRQPLLPRLASRLGDRGAHDLEVDRIVGIGVNVEIVAGVLDVIELVVESGRHQRRLGAGLRIGTQVPVLARRALADADKNVLATLRLLDAHEVAVIRLFVDEDIVSRVRAHTMVLYALGALVVVAFDVIERSGIGRPDDGAPGGRNRFLEFVPGIDRTNTDVVVLRSEPVHAVGDQLVVRTVIHRRDAEELLAFALAVTVVKNRLRAPLSRRADEDRVLAAFSIADRVGKPAVDRRHGAVILFHASTHLFKKLRAKRFEIGHRRVVVSVLGNKVRTDVIIQRRRVAQNPLPVFVA